MKLVTTTNQDKNSFFINGLFLVPTISKSLKEVNNFCLYLSLC